MFKYVSFAQQNQTITNNTINEKNHKMTKINHEFYKKIMGKTVRVF